MKITTMGIDLAKNVFQVHGVDAQGKAVLKKQLKRDQMAAIFANLALCLIGMEACGSAHYWARKLMAPQFVKLSSRSTRYSHSDKPSIRISCGELRDTIRVPPRPNCKPGSARLWSLFNQTMSN